MKMILTTSIMSVNWSHMTEILYLHENCHVEIPQTIRFSIKDKVFSTTIV